MAQIDLRRAMQSFGAGRPNGERALVVAIIGYAARDAADGDAGAAAWFLSAGYRWYLSLLGLPPEWLPAGVTRADLAGQVERAAASSGRQIRTNMRICRNMSQVATD